MLPFELKRPFAEAIRRLLRPVVRQLIAEGVAYGAFDEIVRGLFVEVAESDFALPSRRQTDSRVSLVTGLHRKEIARLRRAAPEAGLVRLEGSAVQRLVGRWMAGPPYADRRGHPKPLDYDSDDPVRPSFAGLVRELAIDAPDRSVLDELLRLGAAAVLPGGRIELRQQALVPTGRAEAILTILGDDPAELFSTIVHNIEQPAEPWFQRKVVYDNVGADAVAALRAEARRLGEDLIRRANALLASFDRDRSPAAPGGARTRVVLGAHWFESPVVPAPSGARGDGARGAPASERQRGARARGGAGGSGGAGAAGVAAARARRAAAGPRLAPAGEEPRAKRARLPRPLGGLRLEETSPPPPGARRAKKRSKPR